MLAQRFEDKTIEQLEKEFDSELSQIISQGYEIAPRLIGWQSGENEEDFTYLDELGGSLVRRSRSLVYPIREAIIYNGTLIARDLVLKGEDDIKFISSEVKDWLSDILSQGMQRLLDSTVVFYKGNHIHVDAKKVRILFRDTLPNIYPAYFLNPANTYEVRLRKARATGVDTFLDIFFAFVNEVRKDERLTTPALRRERLKNLSINTGEIYKLMSVGISTILNIENNHIYDYNLTFKDTITTKSTNSHNYLDGNTKREIFHGNIESYNPENLRKCPAAYSIYLIICKIVDAFDEEFLMTPQEA